MAEGLEEQGRLAHVKLGLRLGLQLTASSRGGGGRGEAMAARWPAVGNWLGGAGQALLLLNRAGLGEGRKNQGARFKGSWGLQMLVRPPFPLQFFFYENLALLVMLGTQPAKVALWRSVLGVMIQAPSRVSGTKVLFSPGCQVTWHSSNTK